MSILSKLTTQNDRKLSEVPTYTDLPSHESNHGCVSNISTQIIPIVDHDSFCIPFLNRTLTCYKIVLHQHDQLFAIAHYIFNN